MKASEQEGLDHAQKALGTVWLQRGIDWAVWGSANWREQDLLELILCQLCYREGCRIAEVVNLHIYGHGWNLTGAGSGTQHGDTGEKLLGRWSERRVYPDVWGGIWKVRL